MFSIKAHMQKKNTFKGCAPPRPPATSNLQPRRVTEVFGTCGLRGLRRIWVAILKEQRSYRVGVAQGATDQFEKLSTWWSAAGTSMARHQLIFHQRRTYLYRLQLKVLIMSPFRINSEDSEGKSLTGNLQVLSSPNRDGTTQPRTNLETSKWQCPKSTWQQLEL